jgi:hypothetical protein
MIQREKRVRKESGRLALVTFPAALVMLADKVSMKTP